MACRAEWRKGFGATNIYQCDHGVSEKVNGSSQPFGVSKQKEQRSRRTRGGPTTCYVNDNEGPVLNVELPSKRIVLNGWLWKSEIEIYGFCQTFTKPDLQIDGLVLTPSHLISFHEG